MPESLFDKYGGFSTFSSVVNCFYQKILDSDEIAPYFASVDMDHLMAHQTNFLAKALGGPDQYEGMDITNAHAARNITESHFNEVAELLEEALEEAGVESNDVATILGIVSGLKNQIVTH